MVSPFGVADSNNQNHSSNHSSQSKAQGPKRSTLSPSCEKILLSLDAIKKRAPKNKCE